MLRPVILVISLCAGSADVPADVGDTLEACLRDRGGSPHTYVGAAQYVVTELDEEARGYQSYSMADIHNARVTDSIRPSAIVFAAEESHVVHAVRCAHRFGREVSARSGGNQYEASCSGSSAGCVIVDVNNMWEVGWPGSGCQGGGDGCVVPLGPGLSLGSAYAQLGRRGYTLPAGTCAQVRVAGLTLGGGKGWLTRKYGMLIDRLRAIDVVLLDGTKVRASATQHEHLFWLARGGGGNIFPGVVTAFHFELVPMPTSPMRYEMEWGATRQCRAALLPQWYARMATHRDTDLWARVELANWSKPTVSVSAVYVGRDEELVEELLSEVRSAVVEACGEGRWTYRNTSDSWTNIVLLASGGAEEIFAEGNNNCGWDLSGPRPKRTRCFGYATGYDLSWAYRSLVMGAGGRIPQAAWDALAEDVMHQDYYVEVDPVNGFAATVASDATAYPHRDAGFITMQYTIRGQAGQDISQKMDQSARTMRAMTWHVPKLGYYNYLDKNMEQYSAVPREAYYGKNADRVERYVSEYTASGIACRRCSSWELTDTSTQISDAAQLPWINSRDRTSTESIVTFFQRFRHTRSFGRATRTTVGCYTLLICTMALGALLVLGKLRARYQAQDYNIAGDELWLMESAWALA